MACNVYLLFLIRLLLPVALILAKIDLFTEKHEMGLMRREGQHDQIRIQTVQTVGLVGLIVQFHFALPDELHYVVLSFPCTHTNNAPYRSSIEAFHGHHVIAKGVRPYVGTGLGDWPGHVEQD